MYANSYAHCGDCGLRLAGELTFGPACTCQSRTREHGIIPGPLTALRCDLCGGPAMLLGQLGNLVHVRCRDCGTDWATPASPAE